MAIDAPLILDRPLNPDERGLFFECYNSLSLAPEINTKFVQLNSSLTRKAGVIRGLHYQTPPSYQEKFLVVLSGVIYNVCVDLRLSRLGRVYSTTLSAFNKAIYIPYGFAHGFQTLSSNSVVAWLVSNTQNQEATRTLHFGDADLDIKWPLPARLDLISPRDRAGLPLRSVEALPE